MADGPSVQRRRSEGRRGSGLLLQAPVHLSEEQILLETLNRLTSVTKAITSNIQNINENLDRILEDKDDIEELETILLQLGTRIDTQQSNRWILSVQKRDTRIYR
ncbi:hypothetical protein AGOR_G00029190 [Albula goreensis]|uniref:Uncharacterized protein n=1 Tax=Albula goreensis TaxID=1534307 RepID=A0A8T3E2K7_9TELE|nr:hypothetical protein AGOR_G00029190 [Albula goreensis]